MDHTGISGPFQFALHTGFRTNFEIEVVELQSKIKNENGFKKIGTWNDHHISYTRSESDLQEQLVENIQNKTFIVVSRLGKPWLSIK